MSQPVLTCLAYDSVTGMCSQQAWVESSGVLPDLPVSDAHQIAAALAVVWIIAFLLRWLRKQSELL